MLVNESNYETLLKVSKETLTDYEIRWFNAENIDGYIDAEGLFCMVEDLLYEIENWKEKYEDLENSIHNDYDPELEIPQIHGEGISY